VCSVTIFLRQPATGTGHVDHHRGNHARHQVAHREAKLSTPLTLLVLNADGTEEATEDEIRQHVLSFSKKGSGQRQEIRKCVYPRST